MSNAFRYAPRYTVKDYRQWQGDWELWNGLAIAMTPSSFGRHQNVLAELLTILRLEIERQGCHAAALSELDWIVADDTVVRPDVVVVCGEVPERHLESPPALVAEVLSPSTRQHDQSYKRELYAQQGVGTYLLIDPDSRKAVQLTLNSTGEYELVDSTNSLTLQLYKDCEIAIPLAQLFR
ncbi:MAG: Uma2 family endonuclease [bacterium]|nr:Uma2 family endonuclease [bacterium]